MEDLTKSDEIEFTDEVFSFPPVRIAVVAHKENDWFQESVASFANLNYLDKQFTVLTTGEMEWVEPIVSQYFPDAEILEVDPEAGLGANFNAVLSNHDEPAFYLFCHHDVALAPDALRLMVEESYRSNAAVVGPKVVNWERPNELLDVGNVMNSLAVAVQRVEAGEIDQEQFDSVEQVFAVSNTAFLVRADLFRALGGFDEEMGMFGEDLDFCWRAQIAGGKIMVVPGAIARHRDESGEYQTNPKRSRLMERHRLRSVLSNYGKVRVLPMLLLSLLISTIKGILGLLRGRLTNLLILIDSFIWNLLNVKSLIQKRKVNTGGFVPSRQSLSPVQFQTRGRAELVRTAKQLETRNKRSMVRAESSKCSPAIGRFPRPENAHFFPFVLSPILSSQTIHSRTR